MQAYTEHTLVQTRSTKEAERKRREHYVRMHASMHGVYVRVGQTEAHTQGQTYSHTHTENPTEDIVAFAKSMTAAVAGKGRSAGDLGACFGSGEIEAIVRCDVAVVVVTGT